MRMLFLVYKITILSISIQIQSTGFDRSWQERTALGLHNNWTSKSRGNHLDLSWSISYRERNEYGERTEYGEPNKYGERTFKSLL